MKDLELLSEDESIFIDYTFGNVLVEYVDDDDYINHIEGTIYLEKYSGKKQRIGKFSLKQMLLGLACNEKYDTIDLCSSTRAITEIMSSLKDDFAQWGFSEAIDDAVETNGTDVLIIERIEILPKYRSNGIGKRVVKDIIRRFSSSVDLIALKAFPIQFEPKDAGDNFKKRMKYSGLEQNEELANTKLKKFYKDCGFYNVKGVDESILLMNQQ